MRNGIRFLLVLILGVFLVALIGCSDDDDENENLGTLVVSGLAVDTAGNPIGNTVVTLQEDSIIREQGITNTNGEFTITHVSPGTYTVVMTQFINSIPVEVRSVPFTVTDTDATGLYLVSPRASDLVTIDNLTQSALVVNVINEFGQLVPATVEIQGITGTFGPDMPVVIPNVPTVTRDVFVTVDGVTTTVPNVSFPLGTVVALTVQLGVLPPGAFTISGNVVCTLHNGLQDVTVQLIRNGEIIAETTSQEEGFFSFAGVEPGTYTFEVTRELNGVPVVTTSGPVTVTDANLTDQFIVIPYAGNTESIGTPTEGALLVSARDASGFLMDATVEVEGVSGTFGPGAPVVIPEIPVGTRDVTVFANGESITVQNVAFTAGIITALDVNFGD